MGDFDRKMRELEEQIGDGRIVGRVSFTPQKIAVPQHRGFWASGPNAGVRIRNYTTPGTGTEYVTGPLLENGERYFHEIARELLAVGARLPLQRAVDDLRLRALERVPRKTSPAGSAFRHPVQAEVSEELAGVHG